MQITTLIENHAECQGNGLVAEHGLSLHIEHDGRQLLFDTGASGAFASNASRLGIDLNRVDAAVLSHHHFDHGGGLESFFGINNHAPVYLRLPPDGEPYFRTMRFASRHIGLPEMLLEKYRDRFLFLEEFSEVLPDVFIITRIEPRYDRPRGNRLLYLKTSGGFVHDPFDHELMMVLRGNDGPVVFTGCSHSGALNMIRTVMNHFPGEHLRAVIGGFHLLGLPLINSMGENKARIVEIGHTMKNLPVGQYWTGHCTGKKALGVLQEVLGDRLSAIHAGTKITI
jgi:7,8-dihydropterin-6-yl-methyl-4-(beta-D-ribofuranosyl)aminobenzene 5'-phosphate synthase